MDYSHHYVKYYFSVSVILVWMFLFVVACVLLKYWFVSYGFAWNSRRKKGCAALQSPNLFHMNQNDRYTKNKKEKENSDHDVILIYLENSN